MKQEHGAKIRCCRPETLRCADAAVAADAIVSPVWKAFRAHLLVTTVATCLHAMIQAVPQQPRWSTLRTATKLARLLVE